jgi:hypothetical protein
MTYYLTKDQYYAVWFDHGRYTDESGNSGSRLLQWNIDYKPKFNLGYAEDTYLYETGYYGYVVGDEKRINWFLLSL